MRQEPAQLDKKAELILEDGRFATIHKVKLGHVIAATDPNDLHSAVKLIALCVKIDDKLPTIQEILNIDINDFHKIMAQLSK